MRDLTYAVPVVSPRDQPGGLSARRIRRLLGFVEENLSEPLRISDLSRAIGLSVPHFSRAFRQSFGEPPHIYVIRRRLDQASRLMLTSDMTLTEVALVCGFNDQAHLSRLFRQHTGRTPTAWRREVRGAHQADPPSPLERTSLHIAALSHPVVTKIMP